MRLDRLATALAALSLRCHQRPRAPHPVVVTAPRPSPPAAPARAEAWSAAFSMRHGVADFAPSPDVAVHAPPGFDDRAPLHLVVVLHGMGHSALRWAGSGLVDGRTGQAVVGWGGEQRHDLAGTRTLLVAPQFDDRPRHDRLGRFAEPGGFRRFLEELLGETLAARLHGPRSLSDVASVTLVGSSAGGPAIAALLDLDDLDGRVRNVVLFDSIFGAEESYVRWLRADPARRLVCLHEGLRLTAPHAARLASLLRPAVGASLALEPAGSITEAVRFHRAVVARLDCEHIGLGPAYLDKVLRALDLPMRDPDPDPKSPVAPAAPSATALPWNTPVVGSLAATDALARDGSTFDDYAIDLAAGERATITLVGAPVAGTLCARLDTELRVLDGDALLDADDDGGGFVHSRLSFRAPRAGRFTVRAASHGPWLNPGDYSLRLAR